MTKLICSVDGCEFPVRVKSRMLCRADYALWARTGSTDIQVTRRKSNKDTDTHKACVRCSQLLPRESFYRSSKAKDGIRGECKECMKEVNRSSYARNRETTLVRQRQASTKPERIAYMEAYRASYWAENRERSKEYSAERRALMRLALRDTGITIAALAEKHGTCCHFCGTPMRFGKATKGNLDPAMASIEHLQPLSRGGEHSWENVRLACLWCNTSKNKKTEEEFRTYLAVRQDASKAETMTS